MPKFLERRLRAEASAKGMTGRKADQYVYGTMNNMGAMRGSKETAKGARMDAKHERDAERQLHPALKARAQMVKDAHAHLSKAIPGFNALPAHQRMQATQEHVRTRIKNGHGY